MSQVLHQILERSACLTKSQLLDYTAGRLIEEEVYSVETHLNSCAMCSAATDSVRQYGTEAVRALSVMDGSFLKKYFEELKPQIHLNSVAPAMHSHRKKGNAFQFPVRSIARLTAIGLAAMGIFWVLNKIAQMPAPATDVKEVQVEKPLPQQTLPAMASPKAAEQPVTEIPVQAIVSPQPEVITDAAVTIPVAAPKAAAQESPGQPEPVQNRPEPAAVISAVPAVEKEATEKKERQDVPPVAAKAAPAPATNITSEEQQFQRTIKTYKKDLDHPEKEQRNLARLVSANAYIGLGQPEKARELLELIMDEGGPHKSEARRTLRKLRRER